MTKRWIDSERNHVARKVEEERGSSIGDVILSMHFSLSYREIAEQLGVSEVTLIKWRKNEGLFVKSEQHGRMRKNLVQSIEKRHRKPIREVVLSTYGRKRNWHTTADALGISYRTLIRWRRNMEIK